MEILAQRLKLMREEQGQFQTEVAKVVGITERTYIRYEKGEREPQASVLAKLAHFYGVSADYLLGLRDER